MQIVGVAAAGGSPLFVRPLAHGADPHRLAWELGYRIVRPLSASGAGDDLSLTLQVSAHGRPITALGRQRVRQVDHGAKLDPGVEPLRRQRLAAYGIVLSDRGILGTEFSARTAVPGLWGLPGGGIDPGENPSQAVIREVVEETGQEIDISHLLDVQSDHWIGRAPNGVLEDFHAVRIIYAATSPQPDDPAVYDVGGTTASAAWIRLGEWTRTPWAAGARALLDRHLSTLVATYRHRKNRSAG
ncbi:MAG: NUDIX domain-containing protein [Micropruina sp.]